MSNFVNPNMNGDISKAFTEIKNEVDDLSNIIDATGNGTVTVDRPGGDGVYLISVITTASSDKALFWLMEHKNQYGYATLVNGANKISMSLSGRNRDKIIVSTTETSAPFNTLHIIVKKIA